MNRIVVSRLIGASPEEVWGHLADLGTQADWMRDAVSIEFVTEQTAGVGTVMRVETRVGPFRTFDLLEVTSWVEGRSITVAHRGAVTGEGIIQIDPADGDSLVIWTERLSFPWWLGGPVGARLARPFLVAVWRGNLKRLEASLRG